MTKKTEIKNVKAREILDSRGNPTLEVCLETSSFFVLSSVPSGASVGKHEAVELRDGGKRYSGKGVLKAVQSINRIIGPKIKKKDVTCQKELDDIMISLDGTENKSKLGANAILGVSMAVCRAGAKAKNMSLYKYISRVFGKNSIKSFPKPCFNVINGGAHAGNKLDFQEFMLVPQFSQFSKNLQKASEIYQGLRKKLGKNVGDEGGFAPFLENPEQVLDILSNYDVKIAIDVAASEFFSGKKYKTRMGNFDFKGLVSYYEKLVQKYKIISLEDPFFEDDWPAWQELNKASFVKKKNLLIIGDDLLATNPKRMEKAEQRKACNGAIIKPNQIGTITETLKAIKLAKSFGWKITISHRSGETNDDFIADLAVGVEADFIKTGAPARGERVAKYNRLLEIEKELT